MYNKDLQERGKTMKLDIGILDLLALIDIFEEYDEFEKDLMKVLSGNKNSIDTLAKIRMLSKGEKGIYPKKVKLFVEKYRETINKINKYTNVQSFIYHSIDFEETTEIYQYLKEHKNELSQIKEVVLRLQELGVEKIEFDENFDFTKNKYYMSTWMYDNTSIHYVDNIDAIPGYQHEIIYYQTSNSPFEIKFDISFGQVSSNYNKTKLNSLIFDKDKLPKNVSKEEVINPILEARQEKISDYNAIKNIIDLRETEKIIESKLIRLEEILKNIDVLADKESVRKSLQDVKKQLENIRNEINRYEDEAIFESTYLTPEIIDQEEKAYERRKRDSECHIW